ncbi:hypothetical protein T4B_9874 [Trichinella pseudospiralis]|uniref:CCHC-type domain-containing protein n=1 Tax=Trichinella pseudospiralis TaxID=6337 RepID=A0A0V1IBL2_TRIPS|nr:hypothetical protein T4B_9874 [Trichinella pseudospiralis]KRZ30976.1 hypothetical protein T4C_6598 [Trichinella pseudospiralis]
MHSMAGEFTHQTNGRRRGKAGRNDGTSNSGGSVTSSAAALAVAASWELPVLWGEHKGAACHMFTRVNLLRRMAMVRSKGVCFKCLESGHQVRDCRQSRPCAVDGCERTHHEQFH